jgi:copper(I)-binding protein
VGAAATGCLSGCSRPAVAAAHPIQVASAYVVQPAAGAGPVYVVIENAGPADRLVGVRSSAGGQVLMLSPDGTGSTGSLAAGLHSVRAIAIPAKALIRLTPAGDHLLITGAGRLRAGSQITLTLLFRHAGAVRVAANVTNPQTGGGSYLGD